MKITTPTAENSDELNQLFYETWMATYPNEEYRITREDIDEMMSPKLSEEELEKRKKVMAKRLADSTNFMKVVVEDEKIVGTCWAIEHEDHVHLRSLYVLPEWQGKGVGSLLMKNFLEWANKDKRVVLHVTTYNTNAIEFYKKWGFVDTGKRFSEERFRTQSGHDMPEMEMELVR